VGTLDGKVALITGAARGQGRSHSLALAKEGADIIAIDLCRQIDSVPYPMSRPADLAETAEQVRNVGRRVVAIEADVRDADGLAQATRRGVSDLGRLDIVLANAGIVTAEQQGTTLAQAFRDAVDVNLTGVFLTIEAARKHLIDGGRGGSIVITSSLAGLRSLGVSPGYSEAKRGLIALMHKLAIEFAPHMVRVNSVHPTNVRTPMIMNPHVYKAFRPDLEAPGSADVTDAMASVNLLPIPWVEAVDVSNAILFLVGETCRYITGVALPVDAGGAIK